MRLSKLVVLKSPILLTQIDGHISSDLDVGRWTLDVEIGTRLTEIQLPDPANHGESSLPSPSLPPVCPRLVMFWNRLAHGSLYIPRVLRRANENERVVIGGECCEELARKPEFHLH